MSSPYRAVLRTPGGPAFCAAAFVARMPISMHGIGIVLLVASTAGSYGVAGGVAATSVLLEAVGGPMLSRWADRRGQAAVLLPAVAIHTAGLTGLVVLAAGHAPVWTLFGAAAIGGGAFPPIGSLVRARWAATVAGTEVLSTAYSLESVLDEVIFVVGPPLVTLLAIGVWPGAGVLAAVGLTLGGGLALAAQRRTDPPGQPAGADRPPSALRAPGLRVLAAAGIPIGGIFGSVEVGTVAFTAAHREQAAAGVVLALLAFGSLLAGLWYGSVRWRAAPRRRFLVGVAALAVAAALFPVAPDVPVLAALALAGGLAISPTLIAAFGLVESVVPAAARTEGFSWFTGGIGVGVAAASSVAGAVVDAAGARTAFLVTLGCGLTALAIATAGAGRLGAPSAHRGSSVSGPR